MIYHKRCEIGLNAVRSGIYYGEHSKVARRRMAFTHTMHVQHVSKRLRYVYPRAFSWAQALIKRTRATERHAAKLRKRGAPIMWERTFMSIWVRFVPERLLVVFI